MSYGQELILDIHGCKVDNFNRIALQQFFTAVIAAIGATPGDVHFWDDVGVPEEEKQTDPRLVGTSAIQFILTSNITIHTLDLMETVYLNVFSCEEFDVTAVEFLAKKWFGGKIVTSVKVIRE